MHGISSGNYACLIIEAGTPCSKPRPMYLHRGAACKVRRRLVETGQLTSMDNPGFDLIYEVIYWITVYSARFFASMPNTHTVECFCLFQALLCISAPVLDRDACRLVLWTYRRSEGLHGWRGTLPLPPLPFPSPSPSPSPPFPLPSPSLPLPQTSQGIWGAL